MIRTGPRIKASFFDRPLLEVAPDLVGRVLVRDLDEQKLVARIVETEAYHQNDEASHTFRGETPRNRVMFQKAGHLYVYLSYGIHHCMNIVTGDQGEGSAVLIRALQPLVGVDKMTDLRLKKSSKKNMKINEVASGPGKACSAMNINLKQNGLNLLIPGELTLHEGEPVEGRDLITTTRIGITRAVEKPWRFYLRESPHVSRP